MKLTQLNSLTEQHAGEALESCCVAPRWVQCMLAARPYSSDQQVLSLAQNIWGKLDESDFLAAFEGHPQIGDMSSLRAKFAATAEKAGNEQAGMSAASEDVLQQMMTLNKDYLAKFGFIFIVCATGKTAEQMLTMIKDRINHDRATELQIAATEQAKIINIRLEKLL